MKWHNFSADDVLKELGSGLSGLSEEEAARRLRQYGSNELAEKGRKSPVLIFLHQFASPLIYILLIAALIELFVMRKPTDAAVIFAVLLINAIIGFVQESRAEQAMEALKHLASPRAKVRRAGMLTDIPASHLVPGDIIVLEAGDKVPADGRLIEAVSLAVDESILTGESVPVEKFTAPIEGEAAVADMGNMVHMGCAVVGGRGIAVITATGMSTEIGRITTQVQEVKPPPTPLQRNVSRLGRYIAFLVLGIISLLIIIGLSKGYSFQDMFTLAVAAAVSAIPEGLPVMVTVVLALGMRRMAQRHALVRKLTAVEAMGAVNVICSDKTGTITESEMTVRQIYLPGRLIEVSGAGYRPEGEFAENGKKLNPQTDENLLLALRIGALCNDSSTKTDGEKLRLIGDPTEGALLVAALKAGLKQEKLQQEQPRLAELPFSSEKRYMATLHPYRDGKAVVYVKGSVDRVLTMCRYILTDGEVRKLTPEMTATIEETNLRMASQALRVLALAYAEFPAAPEKLSHEHLDGSLVFAGLTGMIDPPRPEAKKAVERCRRAGIKVVMITGDQKPTAVAIARELGLTEGEAVTGLELEKMNDEELKERIERITVFARVEPLHKLRIVNALKAKGYIVAMTGDGVNDGPALRSADIGIAMGIKGTDVAREASDMILTDDNFASIVAAVEEGRVIFSNIRRAVFYLLSTGSAELIVWIASILAGMPLPVVAVQILWINMITGSLGAIPLGAEPKHQDVMDEPPRQAKTGIVYIGMLMRIGFIALIIFAATFFLFQCQLSSEGIEKARTIAFTTIVAAEWFNAFNARSDRKSVFKLGFFSNRWLIYAIGAGIALQMTVIYAPPLQKLFYTVPLGPGDWGIIVLMAASVLVVEELRKLIAPRLFSRGK
ncbi:MAG: calcium-transporting P-type ATPase, PMR1-type [Dehalococcoidales bacterium]|nr:calcium-transporting P-type ATPase, PMR1-type [Dehalococcoidales bacterium]